jgi:hypothetical protein
MLFQNVFEMAENRVKKKEKTGGKIVVLLFLLLSCSWRGSRCLYFAFVFDLPG